MIRRLFRAAASLLLLAAASLFIAGFAALGFASFLLTWPFVHGSPTRRRVTASIDLFTAFHRFILTMPSPNTMAETIKMGATMAGNLTGDEESSRQHWEGDQG